MAKEKPSSARGDLPPRSDATPSASGEKPTQFGKYDMIRLLGQGGMGKVYLAIDRDLKRTVAIKLLSKEKAENPILVKRFKAEGQAAANLNHENIIRVFDSGEHAGQLYLALEYVDGKDAHQILSQRGPFPVKRSINIIEQVGIALDHASKAGVVHRDIKPSNIMIRSDGVVKLADMGLARSLADDEDAGITRAGTTVGTVDYMSPEQARNSKSADIRSDLYSLGATWYQLLTGQPPFPGGDLTNKLRAHASSKRPDPADVNSQVPEAVSAVIARMMAIKPDDRYQTVQELLEDMASIKGSRSAVLDAVLGPSDENDSSYDIDHYDDEDSFEDYDSFDEDDSDQAGSSRSGRVNTRAVTRELEAGDTGDAPRSSRRSNKPGQEPRRTSKSGDRQANRSDGVQDDDEDFDPLDVTPGKSRSATDQTGKRSSRSRQQGGDTNEAGPGSRQKAPNRGSKKSADKAARTSKEREQNSSDAAKTSASGRRALPPRSVSDANDQPRVSVSLDPAIIRNVLVVGAIAAVVGGIGWIINSSGSKDAPVDPQVGNPFAGDPKAAVRDPAIDPEQPAETGEEPDKAPPVTIAASTLTSAEQQAINALPPLAPRSGLTVPEWVGPARILKGLPAHIVNVSDDSTAEGHFASLKAAIQSVPSSGGQILLSGPGPHRIDHVEVRSIATIALLAAADGPRPVIELVCRDDSKPVLDFAHSNLILSGVDIFCRDETGSERPQDWISIDASALTVLNCSFTDVSDRPESTMLRTTSGRVPVAAFRRFPGRTLLVDSTFRGKSTTALATRSAICDVVSGNCYIDSGSAPAIRYETAPQLITRLANRDGKQPHQMLIAGNTIFSEGPAFSVAHTAKSVIEPTDLRCEQSLLASRGDAPMLALTDWPTESTKVPTKLAVSYSQSTFPGWATLLSWKMPNGSMTATTPAEWREAFPNAPLQANQLSDAKLETPIRYERPANAEQFRDQWSAAIQQRVGAELLQCDLTRNAWPADGYGERFLAHAKWPRFSREPLFKAARDTKVLDVTKNRLLSAYLEGTEVQDGDEIQLVGTGRLDISGVNIGDRKVRLICQQQGEGITFNIRPNRRDTKPAFIVGAGTLELVNAIIEVPVQAGSTGPASLFEVGDGQLGLRRCRVVDSSAAGNAGTTLISMSSATSRAIVTDSIIAGPGSAIAGPKDAVAVFGNNGVIVGESLVRGAATTYASHNSVRTAGFVVDAGDSPSGRVWAERNVLAPAKAIVSAKDAAVLRSIDWYGLENVFAAGTPTSMRGESAGNAITPNDWTALWPNGRAARPRATAVGPMGAGTALNALAANSFELPKGSPAAAPASDGLMPGVDASTLGPDRTKSNATEKPTRPRNVLPF